MPIASGCNQQASKSSETPRRAGDRRELFGSPQQGDQLVQFSGKILSRGFLVKEVLSRVPISTSPNTRICAFSRGISAKPTTTFLEHRASVRKSSRHALRAKLWGKGHPIKALGTRQFRVPPRNHPDHLLVHRHLHLRTAREGEEVEDHPHRRGVRHMDQGVRRKGHTIQVHILLKRG